MFDTDLSRDYEAATSFRLDPRSFFDAGVEGALCDEKPGSAPADRRVGATGPGTPVVRFPGMAIAREAEPVGR